MTKKRSRSKVHTLHDCPEAIILVKHFNSYDEKLRHKALPIDGFRVGKSLEHLHFSRPTLGPVGSSHPAGPWASWTPTLSDVRTLIKATTCPKEDLPKYAVQEPDYNIVHLKFIGPTKVMTAKTIAREIAIARLEGKL